MPEIRKGGFLIDKIHFLGKRIFGGLLRNQDIEINPGQGRILYALWQNDGMSIKELAKQTALGKSTLTTMLDRLENEGFLTRTPSKKDRRIIIIESTETAKQLYELYSQVSQEMISLFYDGFTVSEIEQFEGFLERVLENLLSSE